MDDELHRELARWRRGEDWCRASSRACAMATRRGMPSCIMCLSDGAVQMDGGATSRRTSGSEPTTSLKMSGRAAGTRCRHAEVCSSRTNVRTCIVCGRKLPNHVDGLKFCDDSAIARTGYYAWEPSSSDVSLSLDTLETLRTNDVIYWWICTPDVSCWLICTPDVSFWNDYFARLM